MDSFPVDDDGYLINVGSSEKFQPEFIPLLNAASPLIESNLSLSFIGLYVRGSISLGQAYYGTSDADFVVVTNELVNREKIKDIRHLLDELGTNFPIIERIDLSVVCIDDMLANRAPALHLLLLTQSAFMQGTDIRSKLPKLRPDRELARYLYPHLDEDFRYIRKIFVDKKSPVGDWCKWAMRIVLRLAQCLVMIRHHYYHREIAVCFQNASTVFPDLRPYLEQAYQWALRPTSDINTILAFLDEYTAIFLDLWNREMAMDS